MKIASQTMCAALLSGLALGALPGPASALTLQECSAEYKAAQTAGTLGSQKWNEFRKAQCGSDSAVTPAAGTASTATAEVAKPAKAEKPAKAAKSEKSAPSDKKEAATSATTGNAVFPTAISAKYANEKASRQRMSTCLDQYNANKTANANGGMKWIEKGGGYYSACSKKLKG